MMNNNWQRMNIWIKLSNRFDYNEYASACVADGCQPHSPLEFAQKAGMVSCGLATFPELPVAEAYLKFISLNQQAFSPPPLQNVQPQTGATPPSADGLPAFTTQKVKITFEDGHTEEQEIRTIQSKPCCGGGAVK